MIRQTESYTGESIYVHHNAIYAVKAITDDEIYEATGTGIYVPDSFFIVKESVDEVLDLMKQEKKRTAN